ncbi:hypothetical protein [Luteolibacter marinus]|uniref:hypothetical protein n=1 Tax=Luteolibacter marinus TaxID=2776705 RepID=UPI001865D29F|nr:hypothetical protein [Luteolibacter marinus]
MTSRFKLRVDRQRRWALAGAVALFIVFVVLVIRGWSDPPDRMPLHAMPVGLAAIFSWLRWQKLRDIPDGAGIELDDQCIKFIPASFWNHQPIAWEKVTGIRVESSAIWLIYIRNGLERTQDIPRNQLNPEDAEALIAELRSRTGTT